MNEADVIRALTDMREKLMEIPGIDIELCGSWFWISGNTIPVKHELKKLGFCWASRKQMWYWTPLPRKSYKQSMSMGHIRNKYGSFNFTEEDAA